MSSASLQENSHSTRWNCTAQTRDRAAPEVQIMTEKAHTSLMWTHLVPQTEFGLSRPGIQGQHRCLIHDSESPSVTSLCARMLIPPMLIYLLCHLSLVFLGPCMALGQGA